MFALLRDRDRNRLRPQETKYLSTSPGMQPEMQFPGCAPHSRWILTQFCSATSSASHWSGTILPNGPAVFPHHSLSGTPETSIFKNREDSRGQEGGSLSLPAKSEWVTSQPEQTSAMGEARRPRGVWEQRRAEAVNQMFSA